ncbi:MAG TPA: GTP cyclohydrolase, FolE2/MptA family, partial [Gammaproteobacteria bacterium]|nr:GTP cyclohydrolase, FolE2/MptA family [Gammaproteobacteria bacterium]
MQSAPDTRNLAIQQVGIKSLKHPVVIEDINFQGAPYQFHSVATFSMFVNLPAERKGTHMSRFLTLLNEEADVLLSLKRLPGIIDTLLVRLEA